MSKSKKPRPGQLLSYVESVGTPKQHTKPCQDCPFARAALPHWLGTKPIKWWIELAHGEGRSECHVLLPHQCAGLAIYRANVGKRLRPGHGQLELPPDKELVFATPMEFTEHHKNHPMETPCPKKKSKRKRKRRGSGSTRK